MTTTATPQDRYADWTQHTRDCRACGGAVSTVGLCFHGQVLLDAALGLAGLDVDANLPLIPSAISNVPQPGPRCQHRACESAYAGSELP